MRIGFPPGLANQTPGRAVAQKLQASWGQQFFVDNKPGASGSIATPLAMQSPPVGRRIGPHFFGDDDSHLFQTFNRNKKSLTLDLKHPEGQAVFQKLVSSADAVLDNLRGELPNTLGVCCPARKDINPRNVCAHFSAYGREGPRTTAWPGDDCLMQAEAGQMSLTGEQDGPPTRYGLPIVGIMSGLVAAFGLLAGVVSARASGFGLDMHTSLFDVALHNLNDPGTWYLNGGAGTGRTARSAHPGLVPSCWAAPGLPLP